MMQIYEENQRFAAAILSELQTSELQLTIVGKDSLRIKGKATKQQMEKIRLFKSHIINLLSPKCGKCGLEMDLIENGKTWFCAFGCESRKA